MDNNVQNMKSLRIENIPAVISELKHKKEELYSKVNDLKKIRAGLENKSEQATASFYQVSDVSAELKKSSAILEKKLSDSVNKANEFQERNSQFSLKITQYNAKYDQEKKDLVKWISEWGAKITELSQQFLHYAGLYKQENVRNDLLVRREEEKELVAEEGNLKRSVQELQDKYEKLEAESNDSNTSRNFLSSHEAVWTMSLLERLVRQYDEYSSETAKLQENSKLLRKWIEENVVN